MKTTKLKKSSTLILISFSLILLVQCNGASNSSKINQENQLLTNENSYTATANDKSSEQLNTLIADSLYYGIPAPEETLSYISEEGLSFNPNLTNPVSNNNKYIDSRLKAINLGVYFADVAYTSVFSQPSQSAIYMKAIEELGIEISVFSDADKDIRRRMSNNFADVDSVSEISREAYEIIVRYLLSSNRHKTYALLCVGSYMESIYLALNYAENYSDYTPKMLNKIIEQKLLFDDIYKLLNYLKNDSDISLTLSELTQVKAKFDAIDFQVYNNSASETTLGNLVIKSDNKYEYTEGQFTDFRNAVITLRNEWTGNE